MPIQAIGHAVLKVRNLDRAVTFYHDVLGLPIATRNDEMQMAFFTLGNHHDFAVRAVGEGAAGPDPDGVGLSHVAFCLGRDLTDLRAMKEHLEASGVTIDRVADHNVSASLYLRDPDGNGIELYVDTSDAWRHDPAIIAANKPLTI